jgi:hypothetical protein
LSFFVTFFLFILESTHINPHPHLAAPCCTTAAACSSRVQPSTVNLQLASQPSNPHHFYPSITSITNAHLASTSSAYSNTPEQSPQRRILENASNASLSHR